MEAIATSTITKVVEIFDHPFFAKNPYTGTIYTIDACITHKNIDRSCTLVKIYRAKWINKWGMILEGQLTEYALYGSEYRRTKMIML